MALPELIHKTATKAFSAFCSSASPSCPGTVVRYAIGDDMVTLMREIRCVGTSGSTVFPLARFRYCHELGQWSLLYPVRGWRWHPCMNIPPTLDLHRLIRYLQEDPLGLFGES